MGKSQLETRRTPDLSSGEGLPRKLGRLFRAAPSDAAVYVDPDVNDQVHARNRLHVRELVLHLARQGIVPLVLRPSFPEPANGQELLAYLRPSGSTNPRMLCPLFSGLGG